MKIDAYFDSRSTRRLSWPRSASCWESRRADRRRRARHHHQGALPALLCLVAASAPPKAIRIATGQRASFLRAASAVANCFRVCSQNASSLCEVERTFRPAQLERHGDAIISRPAFRPSSPTLTRPSWVAMTRRAGLAAVHEVALRRPSVARRLRQSARGRRRQRYIATPLSGGGVRFVRKYHPTHVVAGAIASPMIANVARSCTTRPCTVPTPKVVFIGPCIAQRRARRPAPTSSLRSTPC